MWDTCQEERQIRSGDDLSLSEKLYVLQLLELQWIPAKPFGAQLITLKFHMLDTELQDLGLL